MTPQELLFDLFSRAVVLSLPLAVALLAFRRLLISQSSNVWVYALAVGYASFSVLGLMPWALGLQPVSAVFIVLAMICPLLWMAIVVVCGIGRSSGYDLDSLDLEDDTAIPAPPPLILRDPIVPEPVAVFRHHRRPAPLAPALSSDVVSVARSMRGRASSETRRGPKLLPPPKPSHPDLPFVR